MLLYVSAAARLPSSTTRAPLSELRPVLKQALFSAQGCHILECSAPLPVSPWIVKQTLPN